MDKIMRVINGRELTQHFEAALIYWVSAVRPALEWSVREWGHETQ